MKGTGRGLIGMIRSKAMAGAVAAAVAGAVALSFGAVAAASIRPVGQAAPRVGGVPRTPGAQLWVKRYNGSGNGDDIAFALAVSPTGTAVFVTGESVGTPSVDFATVAYDASTGAKLWVTRYNGVGGAGGIAYALGVSPDGGRVFVTGASYGAPSVDYATVAYNTQ